MGTKYTYAGHGTHFLRTADGHHLVIDPFFNGNPATSLTADDVQADYILVSHGHKDHIADAVSISNRTKSPCISNVEIANWLSAKGVEKTHGQHIGGGFHHPFGYLKLTVAFHGSGLPDGTYGGMPAGFLLTTNAGKRIYFAADTALFSDMALIGKVGLDLAVLPIGDNFTMGPDDALEAVKLLKPKNVVPCHYNTWPVIEQDGQAWGERVKKETKATPHILEPGQSLEF